MSTNPRLLLASAATAVLLCVHPAAAQTDTTSSRPAPPPAAADTAPLHAPARPVRHERYRITTQEMQEHPVRTVYEMVYDLRPFWLRVNGSGSIHSDGMAPELRVLVNEQPLGGTDELKQMPIENVAEIRYLPGTEAVQRYGRDYSAGAILVTLRG
jgi:hypothetical protein